jgi:NADH-quinone oxidoreductase subunit A
VVLDEYSGVLIFFSLALILALALFLLSYTLIPRESVLEKVSAYECGFDPFGEARSPFNVKFYLVALLFIVFDLEISFLFPWSVALASLDPFSYWSMILFLGLLTLGFLYEWGRGALEWD